MAPDLEIYLESPFEHGVKGRAVGSGPWSSVTDFGERSFKVTEIGHLGYQLGDSWQQKGRKEERSEKYVGGKLRKLLSFCLEQDAILRRHEHFGTSSVWDLVSSRLATNIFGD